MLITSIGSGIIVGRTGRYKIFPVAGTAIMAVAFLLLSGMDAATPTWQQSVYLFVLGAGIGSCMQVLVLVVQNTVELRRSRCGDVGRDVLPHHRKLLRRSDFRHRCSPTSSQPGSDPRWPQAARRRARRSHRRHCTRCPARWRRRSSTPTPTRSARCSCARYRSRSSASSSRCSSRRYRCARWTRCRRPISARASACRAPSRPRRSSRWRSAG